jgi:hypothetical protein
MATGSPLPGTDHPGLEASAKPGLPRHTECLDWPLIVGPRQLDRVLRVYVDHYNTERPHCALGRCPPVAPARPRVRFLAGGGGTA